LTEQFFAISDPEISCSIKKPEYSKCKHGLVTIANSPFANNHSNPAKQAKKDLECFIDIAAS
jgi:hypothetical protein